MRTFVQCWTPTATITSMLLQSTCIYQSSPPLPLFFCPFLPPSIFPLSLLSLLLLSFLMRKMKYVFQQVIVMDGKRELSTQTINKTVKVSYTYTYMYMYIYILITCITLSQHVM